MKPLLTLSFACLALPAAAQTPDYSALLRDQGLSGARATLSTLSAPAPSDRFALGGVLFLSAVEQALQTRWKYGLSDGIVTMTGLPVLRLPIPENPTPAPFEPATIESLFRTMAEDLALAIDTLGPIPEDADLAVTIDTRDIWFDINLNETRDPGESFADVAMGALDPFGAAEQPGLTIRFDTADSAWLLAYAHLLSGLSKTVIAFSPTEAIATTLAARDAMADLAPKPPEPYFDTATFADLAAIVVGALERRPDPALAAEVRGHLLDVVTSNRTFWRLVARETDNDAEWIPNKNQTSALPLVFPPDTGTRWLAVLADAEALLTGDLLIPHWRLGPGAGVNLARLLEDPPEIDLVGLVQGQALLPYMERGPVIDGRNLRLFEQLVGGDAPLFMVVLN